MIFISITSNYLLNAVLGTCNSYCQWSDLELFRLFSQTVSYFYKFNACNIPKRIFSVPSVGITKQWKMKREVRNRTWSHICIKWGPTFANLVLARLFKHFLTFTVKKYLAKQIIRAWQKNRALTLYGGITGNSKTANCSWTLITSVKFKAKD